MSSRRNSFENLIASFKNICSSLEAKAELNLKQVEEQCREDFASSAKALNRFDEVISGIGEACSELINNYEILKSASKNASDKNALDLPYEIQSDVVKCIRDIYNMPAMKDESNEGDLINENKKHLISEVIKISEKNISDIKNVENTIVEAKQII